MNENEETPDIDEPEINEPTENFASIEDSEENWSPPPLPEEVVADEIEQPKMSEIGTIFNIFLEPGKTFEDLRRKPRFIVAGLIMAVMFGVFAISFQKKLGEERYRSFIIEQNEKSPQFDSMNPAQKAQAVDFGLKIQQFVPYVLPVILFIGYFIGGLLYWLGLKAVGGSGKYLQSVSVFVYSSFPPFFTQMLANFVLLFIKSADDIDIADSQRGLLNANPTMFFNGKDTPVLTTLVSTLDLFAVWGVILAVIGLHKIGRISRGTAIALALVIHLIWITWRIVNAFISGVPV